MRRSTPFTVRRIDVLGTDSTGRASVDVCTSILGAAVTAASAAPVPFRNPRRERDRLVFFLDMGNTLRRARPQDKKCRQTCHENPTKRVGCEMGPFPSVFREGWLR